MAKAKFDIKTEATRPFYAGVGVTDLAVEAVRDYVTDVQKKFAGVQKDVQDFDFEPKALRDQAVTVVNARVDALSKDAKARRAAIEARVAELQAEAKSLVDDGVDTASSVYGDLVKRGETLVERIRRQESTKATKKNAKTTTAKAKTTKTQATKATKTTAKKTASTAKKAATKKAAAPKSSAKATTTAAKKTATAAASATTDAAAKVGD
jgi:Mg-chelatase subunit ChlI